MKKPACYYSSYFLAAILCCAANVSFVYSAKGESAGSGADSASSSGSISPRLVKYSGTIGEPIGDGLVGVRFSLYKDQRGGAPLWMETQNVKTDAQGSFTVLLGSTSGEGLPVGLFSSDESRWLGIQVAGQNEQPRVLLVSVPYALKASDADTLGGKPLSAFVLSTPAGGEPANAADGKGAPGSVAPSKAFLNAAAVTGGTPGRIGKFVNTTDLGDSAMFQDPVTGYLGIGTANPLFNFDVESAPTATSGNQISFYGLTTASPAGNTSAAYLASLYQGKTQSGNSADYSGIFYSFSPQTYHEGTGTVGTAYTLGLWSQNSTTGTISDMRGIDVWGSNASTGKIGDYKGIYIHNLLNGGGGTLTNNYGIFIEPIISGTNTFAIYSQGGKSYFGGNVGIGTTAPTQPLEVAGDVKISGSGNGLRFPDGTKQSTAGLVGTTGPTGLTGAAGPTGAIGPIGPIGPTGPGGATLGANTFSGTQTISSGNLALPTSTAADSGVLTFGGVPYIHNFGTNNTFEGRSAGNFSMNGTGNTASGAATLSSNAAGNNNTAIGLNALNFNSDGNGNTASGANALLFNTIGNNNTANGINALVTNSGGSNNTASGAAALFSNTTGSSNTASGVSALESNASGGNNSAYGVFSLDFNSTGGNNTAIGGNAMLFNTNGNNNIAAGVNALLSNSTGNNNTALGYFAGGQGANANLTGSNNTFVGYNSGPGVDGTANPLTNATAIGANSTVSASNALVLGSVNGVNGATSSVNVGIGTATPVDVLQVVGDIRVGNAAANGCLKAFDGSVLAGTCSSDIRLKKDIRPFAPVLDKLSQLQPVTYNWRADEFPDYHFGNLRSFGLIAQEVEKVFPGMVTTDVRGYKQVNYSQLPLLMLEAIRELKQQNDQLRNRLNNSDLSNQGRYRQISDNADSEMNQLKSMVRQQQLQLRELQNEVDGFRAASDKAATLASTSETRHPRRYQSGE